MNHIETYAKFAIHSGKLNEFKQRVATLVKVVRERDSATLRYDWFINEEKNEAVAMDTYKDETAMYAHQKNAGHYLGEVLECADMAVEFLGMPSAPAREKIAKFKPRLFAFHSGLEKDSAARNFLPDGAGIGGNHIEIFTRFTIEHGKMDWFRTRASQLLEVVREKDPGTLRYDWFYDEANHECIAMDSYQDAPGLFAHMKNAHDKHSELLRHSSVFTEFLGALPNEAMTAVAKYNPNILPFYRGLKPYSSGGFV
jgi:quinol monooxygenase YgiN